MVAGGNLSQITSNIYESMSTIAANIVQNLDAAITNPLGTRTYAELALVLMIITLGANILARMLVRRVSGTALPIGRGL
jgi:phosphate transport system permease protein